MEDLKTTDAAFPAAGVTSLLRSPERGGARERDFAAGSPEVAAWSGYFLSRAGASDIFAGINECLDGGGSRKTAVIVGANWLDFSTWLPSFLTLSAAKADDNLVRHYLIQIAFEELGGRKSDEIHCRLFAEAVAGIGISEAELAAADCGAQSDIYDDFYEALLKAESTAEVLGLNLGVEIIAEENIETLFALLAYSDAAAAALNESVFFRMHRAIEEEHLRLSISNFLRFCGDDEDKRLFLSGFDKSIGFWRSFWNRNRLIIASAG